MDVVPPALAPLPERAVWVGVALLESLPAPQQRVLVHYGLALGPGVAIAFGCRPLPDVLQVLPLPEFREERWWFRLLLLPEQKQFLEHRRPRVYLPE